jgi:hypothetical protein
MNLFVSGHYTHFYGKTGMKFIIISPDRAACPTATSMLIICSSYIDARPRCRRLLYDLYLLYAYCLFAKRENLSMAVIYDVHSRAVIEAICWNVLKCCCCWSQKCHLKNGFMSGQLY